MSCKHRINNQCQIASEIAREAIRARNELCQLCQIQEKPKSLNRAVILTIATHYNSHDKKRQSTRIIEEYKHFFEPSSSEQAMSMPSKRLEAILQGNGVGSQLWKLLEELGVKHTPNCPCLTWAERMNKWGPEGCRQQEKAITRHMKSSAKNYGWGDIAQVISKAARSGLIFKINPVNIYGSLLNEAIRRAESVIYNGPIDVVYALGTGSKWDDNELRYSLRSLEKYCINLGRVFIVGHKPDWCTNVIHIPYDDWNKGHPEYRKRKGKTGGKDGNIIRKILAACKREDLSERFLKASDDQCFLRPIDAATMPALHYRPLKEKEKLGNWQKRLDRTRIYLEGLGISGFHCDAHVITPHTKSEFIAAVEASNFEEKGYTINTLTQNQNPRLELKPVGKTKLTLYKQRTENEIRRKLRGKTYLGYGDGGLGPGLKTVLQELFPTPSRFEKIDCDIPVWAYWTGYKPPVIELCLETLKKNSPTVRILDDSYWTSGDYTGEIPVEEILKMKPYRRADILRAWLLFKHGGVWVDADCIVFRDLRELMDLIKDKEYIAYKVNKTKICSALIATKSESSVAKEVWKAIVHRLKQPNRLGYMSLGPSLLKRVFRRVGWDKIKLIEKELVHPYYGTEGRKFILTDDLYTPHANAYAYMLTRRTLNPFRKYTRQQLMDSPSVLGQLLRRALLKTPEHSKEILSRLELNKELTGVEIGVKHGINAYALLKSHSKLYLHLIDPWNSPEITYRTDEAYPRRWSKSQSKWDRIYRKVIRKLKFAKHRVTIHRMLSAEAASNNLFSKPLDFVFIDGNHNYEAVKKDIEMWAPKIREGGWLCGHDYNTRKDKTGEYGVKRAVDEWAAKHDKEIELGKNNTWFIKV